MEKYLLYCEIEQGEKSKVLLHLYNGTGKILENFKLCFSIPLAQFHWLENCELLYSLGSYAELCPLSDMTIPAYSTWTFAFSPLVLKHVNDQPSGAFLATASDKIQEAQIPAEQIAQVEVLTPRFRKSLASWSVLFNPTAAYELQKEQEPIIDSRVIVPRVASCQKSSNESKEGTAQSFYYQGQGFQTIWLDEESGEQLAAGLESFQCWQRDLGRKEVALVQEQPRAGLQKLYLKYAKELSTEVYCLKIQPDFIEITATGSQGVFYACITLWQLQTQGQRIACMELQDRARFSWRGMMLDTVRQFYTVAEIKRLLRLMALYKLSRFHWHLSDDEAWRVELDCYPQLSRDWSECGLGQNMPALFGSGSAVSESTQIYSKAEVVEIVDYAAKFHIAVLPEFDIPGHSYALIQALPELQESADQSDYHSVQGYSNNALNPGLPATYEVCAAIIEELAQIFPCPYFHYGCDELAEGAWAVSPACRLVMESGKLAGQKELLAHFIKRIEEIIITNGKVPCAWEEAGEVGGASKQTVLFSWKGVEAGLAAVEKGQQVVMCPAKYLYLDMAQDDSPEEFGASWAGTSSLADTYNYEPGQHSGIIGIQMQLWSESMWSRAHFDYLLFPRLLAAAELGWSPVEGKDYIDFERCVLQYQIPLLRYLGVSYRSLDSFQ